MKKKYTILSIVAAAVMIVVAMAGCSNDGYYDSSSGSESSAGKGGSMARFTIVGDYIYTVNERTLKVASIKDRAHPEELNEIKPQQFDGIIETIFPYDGKLFIGSSSAMYIYDISTNPRQPQHLSTTTHFRSCDPVVAYGDRAYVTLNNARVGCGGRGDFLNVYDITNLKKPSLLPKSWADGTIQYHGTISPAGLGVDGPAGKLFVCTNKGVEVYDILEDANEPLKYVTDLTDIEGVGILNAYDLIPMSGLLIVVGKDGLFQFDYTGEEITLLSSFDLRK